MLSETYLFLSPSLDANVLEGSDLVMSKPSQFIVVKDQDFISKISNPAQTDYFIKYKIVHVDVTAV